MDVLGTQIKKASGESCSHRTYSDPFVSSYLSEAPNNFTNSLQRGHAGQQDLALDQLGSGEIKEDAGPFRTEPGACVEPPHQSKHLVRVLKLPVAICLLNLGGMVPMGVACVVVGQAGCILNPQLMGHVDHDGLRDNPGIRQKGP